MSDIEYNDLLFEVSRRLDELNVLDRWLFIFRGKLASGSEDIIQDALSSFKGRVLRFGAWLFASYQCYRFTHVKTPLDQM